MKLAGNLSNARAVALAMVAIIVCAPAAALAQTTWCPGTSTEPAVRLDVHISSDGAAPYVRLSPAGAVGAWLIDYGATESSANRLTEIAASDPRWLNEDRTHFRLSELALPYAGDEQTVANLPRQISEDAVGPQQGVVGTDLLSRVSVEFHYETPPDQHLLITNGGCDLANKGLFLIRQAGFFGSDRRHYGKQGVNVPVIFTRFESRDGFLTPVAPAQLDTGMADAAWPHTGYVNDPLWQTIKADAVRVGRLSVLQCDGAAALEVWALPDAQLQLTDETGFWLTKFPAYYIVPLAPAGDGSPCAGSRP